jgi:hypothetical protein
VLERIAEKYARTILTEQDMLEREEQAQYIRINATNVDSFAANYD